jgi:hypothetical protein
LIEALIYACVRRERRAEAMANRLKLNEKILRDAEPQEGNNYQIFDTEGNLSPWLRGCGSRIFSARWTRRFR